MLTRSIALFLLTLLFAVNDRAQYTEAKHVQSDEKPLVVSRCPWLTKGTAAKVLNDEVIVNTDITDTSGAKHGSCRFVSERALTKYIEIRVGSAELSRCSNGGRTLRGVGNEAVRCEVTMPSGPVSEVIQGRVRNHYFMVSMSGSDHESTPPSAHVVEADALEKLAEQVAGNLF